MTAHDKITKEFANEMNFDHPLLDFATRSRNVAKPTEPLFGKPTNW